MTGSPYTIAMEEPVTKSPSSLAMEESVMRRPGCALENCPWVRRSSDSSFPYNSLTMDALNQDFFGLKTYSRATPDLPPSGIANNGDLSQHEYLRHRVGGTATMVLPTAPTSGAKPLGNYCPTVDNPTR